MTLEDPHPIPLNYASPMPKIRRRGEESWYVVIPALGVALVAISWVFASLTDDLLYGLMLGMFCWSPSILYLCFRIFQTSPEQRLFRLWTFLWCVVIAVILVIQLAVWFDDPGFPNPRFRMPIIVPGIFALICIAAMLLGCAVIRRSTRRAKP